MADFEPVEIDFLLGGNTATEGKKIEQSMDEISTRYSQATEKLGLHQAAIVSLKKDLIGFGIAYKQSTSTYKKSEILKEIEITKKNIIDETEAVRVLKQEISTLGKIKTSNITPDPAVIGKAAVGYNSLGMSVQQVVRELPSATMGLNMFFLAISNNLPILADNIKRTKAEIAAMKAEGQATTPLWKQLAGSLFSWQSVLMIGITLLTLFGKKITEAFSGHESAAGKAMKLQKEYNDLIKEGYKNAETEVEKVQQLERVAGSLDEPMKKRLEAIKKLNSVMPEYNGHLDKETGKLIANKDAMMDYITSLANMEVAKKLAIKNAERTLQMIESEQNVKDVLSGKKSAPKKQTVKRVLIGSGTGPGAQPAADKSVSAVYAKSDIEIYIEDQKKYREDLQKENDKTDKLIKQLNSKTPKLLSDYQSDKTKPATTNSSSATKKQYDSEKDFQSLILDLNKETWDLLAAQTSDGVQKKMDALSVAEEMELQKIRESQQKIIDEYNKAGEDKKGFKKASTLADVDPEQAKKVQEQITNLQAAYAKRRAGVQSDYYNDVKKKAKAATDELVRIDNQYNDQIKEARDAGLEDYARMLESQRDSEKSAVSVKLIEETDLYRFATSQQLDISSQLTNRLIADIETRLKAELAANRITVDDYNAMADKINKVRGKLSTNTDNPFVNLGNAMSNAWSANKAYKNAASDPKATTEQLVALQDAATKANGDVSNLSVTAISGIQGMLNQVIDGLDSLGVFTEQEKKDAENIVGMAGGAANLAMGITSGNWVQAIQGGLDLFTNAVEYFDFKSKEIAREQKKHLQNIADLERAYSKLQRAVDNALGTDVYAAQKELIENNMKQISEYEAWIAQERQKKKKKQDEDAIRDKYDKIEELRNSIEDEARAITESLAQTNAKSLAGELADAMTTAFSSGEDAALAFGDVAEKVMQNAVKNALKLQFLEKPMQAAVDQLAQDMESGGELTGTEQSAFRKKIEDAGKLYYNQLAQYSDLFTSNESGKASGIKGDVANMTEETGTALTGQITAMRLNVVALLNNSKSSLDTVGKVLATLENIKLNTDRLVRMDETLNYLKINGIKVQ